MAHDPGFYARFETALRYSAGTLVDGRLQATIAVDLIDDAGTPDNASAPYELFGPGDVQRLAAGAITRRYPRPSASDAETTKTPLVEFSAADLPWRYTPQVFSGDKLRPWLVLVVAEPGADGIVVRPDGQVTIGRGAQAQHPLVAAYNALAAPFGGSVYWAHVQQVADHDPIARILSPAVLQSDRDYVACVVPAFTAAGDDSWNGSAPVTVVSYDTWRFRTGPAGDFRSLALELHAVKPVDIVSATGKPFGQADVTYSLRSGAGGSSVLATAGALRLPTAGPTNPVDKPPDPGVAADTANLTLRLTVKGRAVISAPRYDEPFSDPGLADPPPGWIDQLRSDARARGAAGMGVATAIAWQDRIADAAAARVGDLGIAHDRIRHVALGVEVTRSLWNRRLPAMPSDPDADPEATGRAAAGRLAVLSPLLGRLPTTTNQSALDALAAHTPDLTPALLSSAGRRALRPGPARTSLGAKPRPHVGAAILTANACVPEPADPAQWRRTDNTGTGTIVGHPVDPMDGIRKAIFAAASGDDALAQRLVDHLAEIAGDAAISGQLPGAVLAALALFTVSPKGEPDPASVAQFLQTFEFRQPTDDQVPTDDWVGEPVVEVTCTPIDLVGFSAVIAAAVDPTVALPPVLRRVLSTLPGITTMKPVEVEPEIDLPLWGWLRDNQPDWMLPGAGDLLEGDVVGLATNPDFVESLLLGANYQTTGELRWRNIPLTSRFSPLRRFWQRADGSLDISPIKSWAPTLPLGDPSLSAGPGAEAVVAFKTQLFRRYPTTLVYLLKHVLQPGEVASTVEWSHSVEVTLADRVEFSFRGNIGDDIRFFGFPVDPASLADYWVVLEEPPLGYQFEWQPDLVQTVLPGTPAGDTNSSATAYRHFALPIRVLIGPLL